MKKILYLAFIFFMLYLTAYFYSYRICFDLSKLKKENPIFSKLMIYRIKQSQKKGKWYSLKHTFIPLELVPTHSRQAILIAEDINFYYHRGFDYQAIRQSFWKNIKKKKIISGGSTISMQLAKNLFLYPRRTPLRKLLEAILTRRMERKLSKRRIIELYINYIELGRGIFGLEAAAQYYFNLSAAQLTPSQASFLAALIRAPLTFTSAGETPFFQERYQKIYTLLTSGMPLPFNEEKYTLWSKITVSENISSRDVEINLELPALTDPQEKTFPDGYLFNF